MRRGAFLAAVAAALTIVPLALATPGSETGPSSSASPYVVRSEAGVVTKSILTVGDSVGGYRMVGIPDGLGAFDNGDGTFTLLMNHELRPGTGVARANGADGAFVSKWTIDKDTLQVLKGEDLAKTTLVWTGTGWAPAVTQMNRLCSADLAPISAYYNPATGKGFNGRLFLDGEESGTEGRAWAHGLDGTSYELPALGRYSWENSVSRPDSGDDTIHVGLADETPGQVYFYLGHKQSTGTPVEKAGLTNGNLYGIKVDGVRFETAAGIPSGTHFSLVDLGSRVGKTGAQLEADSDAAGVTEFLRPEDGSWDPTNLDHFYFVTTNAFGQPSRLWLLKFADPSNPAAGGTIDMVLDGTEGQQMLDNLTVNDRGQVLIQEDVGNNPRLGKVWQYFPDSDTLKEIAHHDPDRFTAGAPNFLTQDEESSGIIPAPFLGAGWYLLDVQAHYTIPGELVEGGQLLAMHVPPGKK